MNNVFFENVTQTNHLFVFHLFEGFVDINNIEYHQPIFSKQKHSSAKTQGPRFA